MSDLWGEIECALECKRFRWRTVKGLAQETGIDESVIQGELSAHGSLIIKSSKTTNKGEELFTTRAHYRATTSPWKKILSSIKNSPE